MKNFFPSCMKNCRFSSSMASWILCNANNDASDEINVILWLRWSKNWITLSRCSSRMIDLIPCFMTTRFLMSSFLLSFGLCKWNENKEKKNTHNYLIENTGHKTISQNRIENPMKKKHRINIKKNTAHILNWSSLDLVRLMAQSIIHNFRYFSEYYKIIITKLNAEMQISSFCNCIRFGDVLLLQNANTFWRISQYLLCFYTIFINEFDCENEICWFVLSECFVSIE